jgi:hypothetical protein
VNGRGGVAVDMPATLCIPGENASLSFMLSRLARSGKRNLYRQTTRTEHQCAAARTGPTAFSSPAFSLPLDK